MVLNLIIAKLRKVPRFYIYLLQPFCINIVKAFWRHNREAGKENVLGIKPLIKFTETFSHRIGIRKRSQSVIVFLKEEILGLDCHTAICYVDCGCLVAH